MRTSCWSLLLMNVCTLQLRGQEAQENGDRRAVIRHELEFTVEMLRLTQ